MVRSFSFVDKGRVHIPVLEEPGVKRFFVASAVGTACMQSDRAETDDVIQNSTKAEANKIQPGSHKRDRLNDFFLGT